MSRRVPVSKRRDLKTSCRDQKPTKKRRRRINLLRHINETRVIISNNRWSQDAKPVHLVAMHARLHHWCYGIDLSISDDDAMGAISAARKLVKDVGGVDQTLHYLRWVWRQERDREQWRRDNNHQGGMLTWRQVFVSRDQVTRWRLAIERTESACREG